MNRRFPIPMPLVPAFALALTLAACTGEAPPPSGDGGRKDVISLVDRWPDVEVGEATPAPELPPRAEIRFDGTGLADVGWSAVEGVADLRVEDGRLVGRSTSTSPVILLELPEPLGADDRLWSARIALAASGGSRVSVHTVREPGPPMPAVVGRIEEWPLSSPLVAGDEEKTYSVQVDRVFTLEMPIAESSVSRVLVRPTNAADADFAIESVRLEFREEHLASIPSGPTWHGFAEVFRETLVSRTPETLHFEVELPQRPWLDLAVGALEQPAPVFRVTVASRGGEAETAGELEVGQTESWKTARVDLGRWAGETVELSLSAVAESTGTLAFWGAPTIRNSAVSSPGAGERPQTVIVFLADTLRSDHLDAWGYDRDTAPTLARLAAEGVRFDDVIAQATWTKASVSSILTSLYPATTGVADLHDKVSVGETTLAEAFRAAGYATFATSSVPFTGQLTNLHQGVEVLYEFGASRPAGGYQSKTAQFWVDTFLDWLDDHHDVPVLAFLHAMDPHSPFRPAEPFDTMWADAASAEHFAAQAARVEPHIRSPLLKRFMAPSREELAAAGVDEKSFLVHEKAWYDGSIRGMDDQLKRLLDRVGELGLTERTLFAFVADHGEEFLEHGRHWHGQTVYGEVANVPFLLWGRGVPRGRVVTEVVQNLDVMPTLLDLAGLPAPERAQGRSLVPLIEGEAEGREAPAFTEHRATHPGEFDSFSVVKGRWKLVWNVDPPEAVAEYELFDHTADPLDLRNLAGEHPDVAASLADEIRRWRAWAEGEKLDESAVRAEMSAEELERLRSLGYVE